MLALPRVLQLSGKEAAMRGFVAPAVVVLGLLSLAGWPGTANTVGAQGTPDVAGQRAVVLGGGGATGRAREIGLLKGLRDAGIDLTQADLLIGTSAGSILGAQVRT